MVYVQRAHALKVLAAMERVVVVRLLWARRAAVPLDAAAASQTHMRQLLLRSLELQARVAVVPLGQLHGCGAGGGVRC